MTSHHRRYNIKNIFQKKEKKKKTVNMSEKKWKSPRKAAGIDRLFMLNASITAAICVLTQHLHVVTSTPSCVSLC